MKKVLARALYHATIGNKEKQETSVSVPNMFLELLRVPRRSLAERSIFTYAVDCICYIPVDRSPRMDDSSASERGREASRAEDGNGVEREIAIRIEERGWRRVAGAGDGQTPVDWGEVMAREEEERED
jgi:hypothetical protein